jgi:hypothetical protein
MPMEGRQPVVGGSIGAALGGGRLMVKPGSGLPKLWKPPHRGRAHRPMPDHNAAYRLNAADISKAPVTGCCVRLQDTLVSRHDTSSRTWQDLAAVQECRSAGPGSSAGGLRHVARCSFVSPPPRFPAAVAPLLAVAPHSLGPTIALISSCRSGCRLRAAGCWAPQGDAVCGGPDWQSSTLDRTHRPPHSTHAPCGGANPPAHRTA